jgi:Domain of unknown function (DUF6438)/Ankyrin repeats (3 copies)
MLLNSLSRLRQPMIAEIGKGARHVPVLTPVALMLTVFLVAGCHTLAHPKDLRSVSVTLKRTACYGTCPVYSVLIHGDGLVEYLGELNVDIPGDQTGRTPPENLIDLLRDFEGIHFFDLQDKYSEACTDLPTAIISILVDGKTKQVSNYFGGCEGVKSGPQVDLARLAEQIDKAAGSGRWVKCDFDCVEGLIQTAFNVNAQAPDGDTPLLIAVKQRDLRKVRILLNAGARVNAADSQGYTALMYASMADKLELVQELLARGADVNAKDKKGFTVLKMAGGQRVRRVLTQARDR